MQYKTSQKSKVIVRGRFNDAKNTHIKNIGPQYFWSRNSIPIITQDVTRWFSDLLALGQKRRKLVKWNVYRGFISDFAPLCEVYNLTCIRY